MMLQCSIGHKWKTTFSNLKAKHWCPECQSSIGERLVRYTFEILFNMSFPKIRPDWLKNPKTKYKLELDGYCKELNIAFEYQGRQHFKEVAFFKNNYDSLEKLQERDNIKRNKCKIKRNKCKELGINLIEIPQMDNCFKLDKLKDYIISQCLMLDIKLPIGYENILIDYVDVFSEIKNE